MRSRTLPETAPLAARRRSQASPGSFRSRRHGSWLLTCSPFGVPSSSLPCSYPIKMEEMDVVPSRGGCVCGGGNGAGRTGVKSDSSVSGTVAIAPGCRITSGADGMKYGNGSGSTDGNNGVGTTVGYVANALNATGCTEVEREGTNGGSTMPGEMGSGEGANVMGGAAIEGAIGA